MRQLPPSGWPRNLAEDKKEYTYPPLWGANSYNSGAGLTESVVLQDI
jgi:cytochrome c